MVNNFISLFTDFFSGILRFDYIIYILIACLTLSVIATLVRYLIKGSY